MNENFGHDFDEQNVFSKIIRNEIPSFKIYEDDQTLAIMDIMPQSKGHVLVITKEKSATFFDLSLDAAHACMDTAKKIAPALMKLTKADGMILKQFNHEVAGQTVFQVHFHLIPVYSDQELAAHSKTQVDMDELKKFADELKAMI